MTNFKAYKEASLQADHTLVVTRYLRSYHDPPSPGTRELRPLVRLGTGHFSTIPQLVLQSPLHVGEKKWAQVWAGIITSKDLPDVPPAPVVIKLVPESFFGFALLLLKPSGVNYLTMSNGSPVHGWRLMKNTHLVV